MDDSIRLFKFKNVAPIPPKGEFLSKYAKIVHFRVFFMFTERNSSFGGRGADFLNLNIH